MAQTIELCSDLTYFCRKKFIIVQHLAGTKRTASWVARDAHAEFACAEQGHIGGVVVTDLHGFTFFDHGKGAQYYGRLSIPIGRTGFVALAPYRMRPPFGAERRFHFVTIDPRFAFAVLPVARAAFGGCAWGRETEGNRGRGRKHVSRFHDNTSQDNFLKTGSTTPVRLLELQHTA